MSGVLTQEKGEGQLVEGCGVWVRIHVLVQGR